MKNKFKKQSKLTKKFCQICSYEITAKQQNIKMCQCNCPICQDCWNKIEKNKIQCQKCNKNYKAKTESTKPKSVEVVTKTQTMNRMLEYYNSIGIPISLEEIFKIRIIQKNLIYVIGLAPQLTKEEELREEEYFGQYGEIKKIVVGKNNVYVGESGPCYSAYLTYANQAQASLAIIGLNAFNYKGRTLRASYGTTKYCNFFLKNQACNNPDCLYLHALEKTPNIFYRDEITNKNIFQDQQKIALRYTVDHQDELKTRIKKVKKQSVFPSVHSIYDQVIDEQTDIYGDHKQESPNCNTGWEFSSLDEQEIKESKQVLQESIKPKSNQKYKKIDILNESNDDESSSNLSFDINFEQSNKIKQQPINNQQIEQNLIKFAHLSQQTQEQQNEQQYSEKKHKSRYQFAQCDKIQDEFEEISNQIEEFVEQSDPFTNDLPGLYDRRHSNEFIENAFHDTEAKKQEEDKCNNCDNQQKESVNNIIINNNNINFQVNNYYNFNTNQNFNTDIIKKQQENARKYSDYSIESLLYGKNKQSNSDNKIMNQQTNNNNHYYYYINIHNNNNVDNINSQQNNNTNHIQLKKCSSNINSEQIQQQLQNVFKQQP